MFLLIIRYNIQNLFIFGHLDSTQEFRFLFFPVKSHSKTYDFYEAFFEKA